MVFDAPAAVPAAGIFDGWRSSHMPLSGSFAMYIRLLRHGQRALLLPRDKDLIDCPPLVRHWLGTPLSESVTEITVDTPLPGISPPVVLAELLQNGYCALDVYGVVRAFSPTAPVEVEQAGTGSAIDLQQCDSASSGSPRS